MPDTALRMPEIASISSDWPLPATPAMPTISPPRTSKDTSLTMVTPRESFTVRLLTASFTAPGFASPFSTRKQHAAADHQLGKFLDGGFRRLAGRDHGALAHDRDGVGDRHDLAQLVRDQHDRLALVLELLEDAEEMVGLGGRQHAGRLVEDQDFGAAIERLEDFDALLQADRQFLDDGVGIDLQAVFALQPLQLGARVGDAPLEQRLVLGAEDDVLDDGEILDQHEMLVDHADAERDGVVRRLDRDRLAADFDLAAVGLVEAVEDRHQRRLSGAVLSDDAADGAALDDEIDVAIGPDSAETLVDSDELDSSFSHAAGSHLIVFITRSKR